jgi:hypothetical protein
VEKTKSMENTLSMIFNNPYYAVRNIADLGIFSHFCSTDEPGQWICWDFHEMRIRPTDSTIESDFMQSLRARWTARIGKKLIAKQTAHRFSSRNRGLEPTDAILCCVSLR